MSPTEWGEFNKLMQSDRPTAILKNEVLYFRNYGSNNTLEKIVLQNLYFNLSHIVDFNISELSSVQIIELDFNYSDGFVITKEIVQSLSNIKYLYVVPTKDMTEQDIKNAVNELRNNFGENVKVIFNLSFNG